MNIAVVVLLSLVNCILAYNFEDQAYNQLLSRQLFSGNPRFRRDSENNCIDINSCCVDEAITNYHRADRTISEQCYTELNVPKVRPEQMTEQQIKDFRCVVECIGKKKGYLDIDGKLIKPKLLEEIKSKLGGVSWLAPKLNDLFDKCLTKALDDQKNTDQCNDIGITVGHCIWKNTQLECPTNKQDNPAKCEDLKTYLRSDKIYPPAPPIRC